MYVCMYVWRVWVCVYMYVWCVYARVYMYACLCPGFISLVHSGFIPLMRWTALVLGQLVKHIKMLRQFAGRYRCTNLSTLSALPMMNAIYYQAVGNAPDGLEPDPVQALPWSGGRWHQPSTEHV